MLKMLGAACVIFSASAVGFGFSGNVRRQCAQLTALIEALTYLKSEMLYRRTPLPQALGMLAEHSADAAVGGLFAKAAEKLEESCMLSVHAAFRAALGMADGLVLSAQTRQALLSLSLSLGQLDLDGRSARWSWPRSDFPRSSGCWSREEAHGAGAMRPLGSAREWPWR